MNEIINPVVYSDLTAPVAADLQAAAARIGGRLVRQVEDIIEIGRDLIAVKAKLGRGQFQRWIDDEFHMSDRAARRFMRAVTWAEGKSDTVSVLAPTSIYLLSAKGTPGSFKNRWPSESRRGCQ